MSFKIVITETVETTGEIGRDFHNTHKQDENGEDIWDYSPSIIGKKIVTEEVFKQNFDDLDLPGLIRYLNRQAKKASTAP